MAAALTACAGDAHMFPGAGASGGPGCAAVVVALDGTDDELVVRRAAEIARAVGARLVGARVRAAGRAAADGASDAGRVALEQFGADFVGVVDDDAALVRIAEAHGARTVVVHGTTDGALAMDVRSAGVLGLELVVVAPGHPVVPDDRSRVDSPLRAARPPRLSRARTTAGLAVACVGPPALTALLLALRGSVDLSTVLLLYLAVTVAATAIGGRVPGLLAAVAGFSLAFYFFTEPYGRWVIDDPDVIVAVAVFLVVALIVSVLTDVASRRTAEALRSRAEAAALARIATAVLGAGDPLPRLLYDLREVFDLDAAAILRRSGNGWAIEHAIGGPVPQRPADATDAIAIGSDRYLALSGARTPTEDSRVLAAFAAQLALSIAGPAPAQAVAR